MNRRAWFAGAAGVALAAGMAGGWWRERRRQADGLAADLFSTRLPQPDGAELDFASFRGRPLIVNFWATWCAPCVRELPSLSRFAWDHAAMGWQVVGVAVDSVEPVRMFLQKLPVSFPVVVGGAGAIVLSERLGNQVGGLPFTALVGADGRIRRSKAGETSYDELKGWISGA